jgi:hypothetical protein
MEEHTEFLALALVAATAVTVGLTSATFADGFTGVESGKGRNLPSIISNILGLDEKEVADYFEKRRSEICYGAEALHLE